LNRSIDRELSLQPDVAPSAAPRLRHTTEVLLLSAVCFAIGSE
jgi:hypothetical protein